MIDPVGGDHTIGGYVHTVVEEVQPDGFGKQQHDSRQDGVYGDGDRESEAQSVSVAQSQRIRDVALRGCDHRAVEKREEHHDATDDIIDAVVVDAESIPEQSYRHEIDSNRDCHAQVKKQGIAGDTVFHKIIVVMARRESRYSYRKIRASCPRLDAMSGICRQLPNSVVRYLSTSCGA